MGVLEPDLLDGRAQFQKMSVVGRDHVLARAERLEQVGQGHVAERLVVSVGFAVGGDVDQPRRLRFRGPRRLQAFEEALGVPQQVLEAHRRRDRPVVEEDVEMPAADRFTVHVQGIDPVGAPGVDRLVGDVAPGVGVEMPDGFRLGGGEDGELDSGLDQIDDRVHVDRGLG